MPGDEVWEKRYSLVDRLKFWGIPLILATGRAFNGAKRAIDAVARKRDTPFVLYNGSAVVTAGGSVLWHHPISLQVIQDLAHLVQDCEAAGLFYCLELDLANQLKAEHACFIGKGKKPNKEFNGLPVTEGLLGTQGTSYVAALLWADTVESKLKVQQACAQLGSVTTTSSGGMYIEVRPLGSTKAVGLQHAAAYLGVTREQVLAVGDNDNDVELLEAVGVGVCVSNASTLAQNASKYKTKYESSTGAIEVLELVTRARRLFSKRG